MFTGIIAAIGRIETVTPLSEVEGEGAGLRLHIHAGNLDISDVKAGDSIAVHGACMTVISVAAPYFSVEVSRESLNCTTGLDVTGLVNLEKALRAGDRLDGHWVTGHVDDVAMVTCFEKTGESHRLRLLAPHALSPCIAVKGSVAVNGVSLTVNTVTDTGDGCECCFNLIAHTLDATTFSCLRAGDQVNLEVDLLARYVARRMQTV